MPRSLRTRRTMRMGKQPAQAISAGRWLQPRALLGAELVVNGAFAADTDWTLGTGWTITGGVAVGVAGSQSLVEQPGGIIDGKTYRTVFTVVARTAGNAKVTIGGVNGSNRAVTGTFTEDILAGAGGVLSLNKSAVFDGSADNFSVREVLRL